MIESYYSCMRGMISRERNSAVKEKQRVGNRTCLLLQCNNDVTSYIVGVIDLRHSVPSKRSFKCF